MMEATDLSLPALIGVTTLSEFRSGVAKAEYGIAMNAKSSVAFDMILLFSFEIIILWRSIPVATLCHIYKAIIDPTYLTICFYCQLLILTIVPHQQV
jgi:hypothetical protein